MEYYPNFGRRANEFNGFGASPMIFNRSKG
jgi:hypothetical protein